jgi:hypothetical protein
MKSINGKIPKLNLETIEITPNTDDNFEKLSTARVIDNMRKRTENYIIDNNRQFKMTIASNKEINLFLLN